MYNEDDLIPALWHEEPVCLRDYPADSSSWDEVQYDEATGLPHHEGRLRGLRAGGNPRLR